MTIHISDLRIDVRTGRISSEGHLVYPLSIASLNDLRKKLSNWGKDAKAENLSKIADWTKIRDAGLSILQDGVPDLSGMVGSEYSKVIGPINDFRRQTDIVNNVASQMSAAGTTVEDFTTQNLEKTVAKSEELTRSAAEFAAHLQDVSSVFIPIITDLQNQINNGRQAISNSVEEIGRLQDQINHTHIDIPDLGLDRVNPFKRGSYTNPCTWFGC